MSMIYREDLEHATCSHPGCRESHAKQGQPFYIHGRCHKGAGLEVSYEGDGVLLIKCHRCKAVIVPVKVASREIL